MNSSPERTDATVDPKLLEILVCPLTKGPLEFDSRAAGTDLALRKTRLPDPRRHPDHAAGRGAEDRVSAAASRGARRVGAVPNAMRRMQRMAS